MLLWWTKDLNTVASTPVKSKQEAVRSQEVFDPERVAHHPSDFYDASHTSCLDFQGGRGTRILNPHIPSTKPSKSQTSWALAFCTKAVTPRQKARNAETVGLRRRVDRLASAAQERGRIIAT